MRKGERLNAAHALLAQGTSMAEAAMELSRDFDLSRRQAYRYLAAARSIGRPVAVGEPTVAATFKLPGSVIDALRGYAASSGLTLGEIISRAVSAYLAAERENG